jgi:hypothetical protein
MKILYFVGSYPPEAVPTEGSMVSVNVLHDSGTLHVPLPAKNVKLGALPILSAQLIALAVPMFVDLSVPLVGTGAAKLRKLNAPRSTPIKQRLRANKTCGLKIPDLEEEFFFMLQFLLLFPERRLSESLLYRRILSSGCIAAKEF